MNEQSDFGAAREEVYRLTESCLRGEISPEELARLEQLLSGDDSLRHYLEYISQSAALSIWATALADSQGDESSIPLQAAPPATTSIKQKQSIPLSFPSESLTDFPATSSTSMGPSSSSFHGPTGLLRGGWWSSASFVLGVLVAAVISGVWLVSQRFPHRPEEIADNRNTGSAAILATPVAYLTSNTGCAWGNESLKLQTIGSSVQLGDEIALQEGIAEFRLANGVYISVEGAAGLVLTSPDSLVLQYGKLTAHVPWPVSEFRILAGACKLTASESDAEFGVTVTGGRVDTHVFSGEVLATSALVSNHKSGDEDESASSARSSKGIFTQAVITQGRALTLVSQNGLLTVSRRGDAAASLFATKLSMAGRLPVSQKYQDAILASRPVGYWRFESGKNNVVENEISGGTELNIVGDLRLAGSSGNRVAEFRPGAECYLKNRAPLDSLARTNYSVEVWVKPSHVHCGAIVGMCARDSETAIEKAAFLLELQSSISQPVRGPFSLERPRSIRFLHRDPPDRNIKIGTSCFSKDAYSCRRWQHVVAVKQGDQMQLYVDGQPSAAAHDGTSLAPKLHLIVGRQETVESSLQLVGQLDELAVYSRALTKDEVSTHYRAINWAEEHEPVHDQKDI